MGKIKSDKSLNYSSKTEAFRYQIEAFESLKDKEYSAIFHEQGLGKTKIALDIALYWLSKEIVDTVLIITKKLLIDTWKREIEKHTNIKPRVLNQNRNNNYYTFNSPARLILANFEIVSTENSRFMIFLKTRDVGIVIDESAKIKNPKSNLTKDFFKISKLIKRKIIMTGTPISNRPCDIWSQIFFLDYGEALGENYKEFFNKVKIRKELAEERVEQKRFEKNIQKIHEKISEFSVRETKEGKNISLPKKEIENIYTDWETLQLEKYKEIRNELKTIIIKDGEISEDISEVILKRLLRLVQVSSNPKLIDEEYNEEPGKMPYVLDLLENMIRKNEKCIIWTTFIDNVKYLRTKISDYLPVCIHGRMRTEDRLKSIEDFINNEEVKVLIATPSSAKEGLTLTVANNVIFYDRSFSLDDYLQAQDRIHRISQNKTCYIYNLIMKNSVDEWIDALLEIKKITAKLGQGDIKEDQFISNVNYSFNEILIEILSEVNNEKME